MHRKALKSQLATGLAARHGERPQRRLRMERLEDRSLLDAAAAFEWARTWGGTSSPDYAYDTAVDGSGNLYVAGCFVGNVDFDPAPNHSDFHSSSGGSIDAFLSKFDASGQFVWARTWGGSGRDVAYGVGVDDAGDVYVVGPYRNTVDFDPSPGATESHKSNADTDNNIYLSKFSSAGDFQWVRAWGPALVPGKQSRGGEAYHVAVTGNYLYVVGDFSGDQTDFNPWGSHDWHTNHPPASGTNLWFDAFLSKFDLNGNFQWARSWGGEGYDDGPGVAVDGLGNVYVSGMYASTSINFDPAGGSSGLGHPAHDSGVLVDVFLSKFDSEGNFQWVRTWGGQGAEDATGIVAVDDANDVYVAGRFASSNCDFDPGGTLDIHSATNNSLDCFLSKFDASGTFQWARTWGGSGMDQANGLAVDAAGRVYVAGSFQNEVDFDPGNSTDTRPATEKSSDAWLSQFDAAGNFHWVQTWGGTGEDSSGVFLDQAGNLFAAGWFAGAQPVDFDPGSGVDNHTAAGSDAFLTKFRPSTPISHVTGRHLFYNNSLLDGGNPAATDEDYDAIAMAPSRLGHGHAGELNEPAKELGKQALRPGQAATWANYTSYGKGINGILVAFDNLADTANLSLADFAFRVGNDLAPAQWPSAPTPRSIRVQENVVHPGFVGHPDIVTLIWADEDPYTPVREAGAISNQWLQVTVLANAHTGLAANDVFYFGNQIGESGNSDDANVDQNDEIGARNHPHTVFSPAAICDPYDSNRDGKVDQNDEILARNNPASAFTRIQLLAAPAMLQAAAVPTSEHLLGEQLTLDALAPVVQEAISRWAATGLDAAQLRTLHQTQFAMGWFVGLESGEASPCLHQVWLDDDAAGFGWFIDRTPGCDEEFIADVAPPTSPAFGKLDLLSAVMHEMGHVLGQSDLDSVADDVMTDRLAVGMRRTGAMEWHDAVFGSVGG